MNDDQDRPYHHGNLREVVLRAAEEELKDRGIEKFSMRSVAKRAGVSHGAPAHHFKDMNGVLTALAARSFERHLEAMDVSPDEEPIVAAGLGYFQYASEHREMFDLQFASQRPDHSDAILSEPANAAFGHIRDLVGDALSEDADIDQLEATLAIWAYTHGLATLFGQRRSPYFSAMSDEAREKALRRMMRHGAQTLLSRPVSDSSPD